MPRILVVEDNEELQELLKITLGGEGFEVHQALDGKEGLELAASIKPDVIVLDMMLPSMSGLQVIKKLQENPATKAIPIIVQTAFYSDVEFLEGALKAEGAVSYLRKPVKIDDFLAAVKSALPRP
jgi:CheY-like chemotaxis protein